VSTTLDRALSAAARALREGGVPTPALDARILLCHATGLSHEALIAHGREALGPEQAARLSGYIARRLEGEPVSRIRGVREFYGRDFLIDPHTLDPRPDTETLIEAALRLAHEVEEGSTLRLLDLGTGSGCILLTLLAELPEASGVGIDINPASLEIARENARRFGLEGRARFAAADWFEGLEGRFDLILANPPYIPSGDIGGLAREVAAYDPLAALDGGPDGLDAYRAIAAGAADFLAPGGDLLVEIGAAQAEAVRALFEASGLVVGADSVLFDLAGRPRCVRAGSPLDGAKQGRKSGKIGLESHDVRGRFEPGNDEYSACVIGKSGAAGCMATRADIS
jgi:release factor glutamine methyltransferase